MIETWGVPNMTTDVMLDVCPVCRMSVLLGLAAWSERRRAGVLGRFPQTLQAALGSPISPECLCVRPRLEIRIGLGQRR